MSEILSLLDAVRSGRTISSESLDLVHAELQQDAIETAKLLKSNRELKAENERLRRLAGFHLDAQITEALSVMELKQQLAASAKQYQEACDDAHKFAVDNEQLRKALEKISSPTQSTNLLWWQKEARDALGSPGSAAAESVKTTRFYGCEYPEHGEWSFSKTKASIDTHYIDIAEDGAIVGGKIASGES